MSDYPTVREQVRETMRCCNDARNNDRILYVELVGRFYSVSPRISLAEWVDARCPDYETVRRNRADVQSKGELLPTDPKVLSARGKKEGEVRRALGYGPAPESPPPPPPSPPKSPAKPGSLFDAGSPPDAH